jgi:hypothetical protein
MRFLFPSRILWGGDSNFSTSDSLTSVETASAASNRTETLVTQLPKKPQLLTSYCPASNWPLYLIPQHLLQATGEKEFLS